MRRRKRAKPSGGVQMFSFLDAMICTMGALLVLLHAFARHGQIEVAQKAEARLDSGQIKAAREDLEWRITQLKQSRDKTAADLAAERLKLSHVEDHERRLREQLRNLSIAADEMNRLKASGAGEHKHLADELERARQELEASRQAVEEGRHKSAPAASAYSVVPYEGPNSTRRRPIYIECRKDSVVLQPEGIALMPEDFAGTLGPGNVLASALRATSEYLARQSGGQKQEEPYPLLLVRPEGIESYYAARAALDSWAAEFGYELVGADWTLKFPDPDPRLADLTRQVVVEARQRHQAYLASVPATVRKRGRAVYHASSHGGFSRAGGGPGGGAGGSEPGGWDSLGSNWARRQRAATSGGGGAGEFGPDGSWSGGGDQSGSGDQRFAAGSGGRYANGSSGGNREPGGSHLAGGGNPGGTQQGSGSNPGGSGGPNGNFDPSGRGGSQPGGNSPGQFADGGQEAGQGESGDRSGDRSSARGGSGSSTTAGGPAGSPSALAAAGGSQRSGQSRSGQSSSGSQAGGNSSSAGGSSQGSENQGSMSGGAAGSADQAQANGMPSPTLNINRNRPQAIAKARGRDWGLPESGPAAVSATRPIAVECYNDHIVILPDAQNEPRREVRLGANTQESMDELVSNVWQHMKSWGVAGKGMYWRPTLWVDVKPGAADRYADMKALLAESGLDVRERQPRPTATRPTAPRPTAGRPLLNPAPR
jgi:hypothetical protein